MLKEMRDSAGDSGEFYTPRAVIKFMVKVINPQLGETILDPACGTGGFLVETFEHLKAQCKRTEDFRKLQEESLHGIEAKSLPYLLCQMNLMLHGLEYPTDRSRQCPDGFRSMRSATGRGSISFLPIRPSAAKRKKGYRTTSRTTRGPLKQPSLPADDHAKAPKACRRKEARTDAGSVVPNGALFGDGVCARIKEELLKDYNLHTIVRLPNGVFAPYTSIPTNLLFFDRGGPTKEIWYYEQPLPEGRKSYTKTKPMQFEEFEDCIKWWSKRKENDRAWKVKASDVAANNFNLDIKNPNGKEDYEHQPPEKLVEDIIAKEQRILEIMTEIRQVLAEGSEEADR